MAAFEGQRAAMDSEVTVTVMDGPTLIEVRGCTVRKLPDGRAGVIWRGQAFALGHDNVIDVGQTDEAVASLPRFALLHANDETCILVAGLSTALDTARKALSAAGIVPLLSGRWLGDPVADQAFDWFIRCSGTLLQREVSAILNGGPVMAAAPELSLPLLEQQVVELRAQLADLSATLHETLRRAVRTPPPSPVDAPLGAPASAEPPPEAAELAAALAQVAQLQSQLDAATRPLSTPSRVALKLEMELAGALAALRPNVVWLRSSLSVIASEYTSRAGVWRALMELPDDGARPYGWKSLRGAEKWWERHVSTGQDDTGRAYARYESRSRCWSVLVSWKSVQSRDVAWLRDQ